MLLTTGLLLASSPLPAPVASHHDEREHAKSRHVHYYVGARQLDDGDWGSLDQPLVGEIGLEWRKPDQWLGYEVGVSIGFDQDDVRGVDVDARSLEFYTGLRATARVGHLRPYVGAGASVLRMDWFGDPSDDDTAIGGYARGGIAWAFDCGMDVGVDYRHVFVGDFELFGSDVDADFDQLALTVGFSF